MSTSYAYGPTYTSGGEDSKITMLRHEIEQLRERVAALQAWKDAVPVEAIRVALMEGNTDFDAQWNAEEAAEAWLKELGVWSGQVHKTEAQP